MVRGGESVGEGGFDFAEGVGEEDVGYGKVGG